LPVRSQMSNANAGPGQPAVTLLLGDPGRLVRAMEAAGAGLWEWDLGRNFVYMTSSLAALLGLAPRAVQVPATSFFEHVHPDDIALFRVALGEALRDERPFTHEFRVDPKHDGG